MFKLSKFNITKRKEDKIIVFNSLTGEKKLGYLNDSIFSGIYKKKLIENNDDPNFADLVNGGIIINNDIDELKVADKVYNSILSANVLELTIIVTDDCNFKCGYCYQENREYSYMNDSVLNGILNYIGHL